jgi:hypothetical protein
MTRQKPDSDRAMRLVELRAELAAAAGFDPDNLSADQRMRVEHGALLLLQRETLTARVIAGHAVDTAELVRIADALAALLPSMAPPAGGHIPLDQLSDEQLATLEQVAEKLSPGPPPPGSDAATIAELHRMNDTLQELVNRANERARIAAQSEQTWKRMADGAIAEVRELRKRLDASIPKPAPEAAPALPATPPTAPAPAVNVVPLRASSGGEWAALAMATSSMGHPALFDGGDPSGKRRGMP